MYSLEAQRARISAAREFAFKYRGQVCSWPGCGIDDKVMLQFHHVDPKEKDGAISLSYHGSLKARMKELDKCIVLCANHHFKTHANEKSAALHIEGDVSNGDPSSVSRFN